MPCSSNRSRNLYSEFQWLHCAAQHHSCTLAVPTAFTMLRSNSTARPGARARPPMKLGRRAALSLLTPMPANAMWQLWLPSDMERFVAEADATADSVLAQMDKCAETSWMMNMGSAPKVYS